MGQKIVSLLMVGLLLCFICGCQSQETMGNGSSILLDEEHDIPETRIKTMDISEEGAEYVSYFLNEDMYSLYEYRAPENIRHLDIMHVSLKDDQILEEEKIESVDFTKKENLRSAVIAVYELSEQRYTVRLISDDGKTIIEANDISSVLFPEGYTISYKNNILPEENIVVEKHYPLFTVIGSPEDLASDQSDTSGVIENMIYAVFY